MLLPTLWLRLETVESHEKESQSGRNLETSRFCSGEMPAFPGSLRVSNWG